MNQYEKRWQTLIEKHGSEEAVREFFRAAQKKSRENYKGTGGFKGMSEEKAREIRSLGGQNRWKNRGRNGEEAKDNSAA